MPDTTTPRGCTTRDAARLFRVGEDTVRAWIRDGQLAAVNTAGPRSRKPRFVILPEAIEQFASARSAAAPPTPRRTKKRTGRKDYFPHL